LVKKVLLHERDKRTAYFSPSFKSDSLATTCLRIAILRIAAVEGRVGERRVM
jgi:hypothetical protein